MLIINVTKAVKFSPLAWKIIKLYQEPTSTNA